MMAEMKDIHDYLGKGRKEEGKKEREAFHPSTQGSKAEDEVSYLCMYLVQGSRIKQLSN